MKLRAAFACILVAGLASASPARAARQVEGTVAAPTFGSPGPARIARTYADGVVGRVIPIGASDSRFTLEAATPLADFDIFFYESIDAPASQPLQAYATAGAETGRVPHGARWAVVTLATGANATFRYSV